MPPGQAGTVTRTGVLRPKAGRRAPGGEEALPVAGALGEGVGPRAPRPTGGASRERPGLGATAGAPWGRAGGRGRGQAPPHPGARDLRGRGGLGCGVKSEEPTAEGSPWSPVPGAGPGATRCAAGRRGPCTGGRGFDTYPPPVHCGGHREGGVRGCARPREGRAASASEHGEAQARRVGAAARILTLPRQTWWRGAAPAGRRGRGDHRR